MSPLYLSYSSLSPLSSPSNSLVCSATLHYVSAIPEKEGIEDRTEMNLLQLNFQQLVDIFVIEGIHIDHPAQIDKAKVVWPCYVCASLYIACHVS